MSAKKTEEKKFFKEQIINSEKFGKSKDLLSAVLDDKTAYTEKDINSKIAEYMKRRVE